MAKNPRIKVLKAWGGFADDKLHVDDVDDDYGPRRAQAIYLTRDDAKKRFEDVRRISIVYETRK